MMNILVVDDSKSVHAFVGLCLSKFDVRLTHVFNGQEAVSEVLSHQGLYDLILIDWEMPVMDGPSAIAAIGGKGTMPMVMMTNRNSPTDISNMLKQGVSEYVLKPFTPDTLLERIERALEQELVDVTYVKLAK